MALGTVTARVVVKAMPALVETCVPAGMGTAMNVLVLENVTVPVAAVSATFWPVAVKVPLWLTSKDFVMPGTVSVA